MSPSSDVTVAGDARDSCWKKSFAILPSFRHLDGTMLAGGWSFFAHPAEFAMSVMHVPEIAADKRENICRRYVEELSQH